jgi:hypothetical protein
MRMEKQALYYPYIRLPEAPWFTQVLLYWDGVGTILPRGINLSEVGDYTKSLIDAGLVRRVYPLDYISDIPDFGNVFLGIVDRDAEIWDVRSGRRRAAGPVGQINVGKLNETLVDGLERRGLAWRSAGSWLDVEPRTAAIYMAYLAATARARRKPSPELARGDPSKPI